jgi:hypothetical protein
VVRGPAAVLALLGAALAYVLVAPSLPQLHPPELSALVGCAIGLALIVAIVAGLVPVADAPLALAMGAAGAALIVAALDINGVAGAATPFEAVLFACAGIAFVVALDVPLLAVALPAFVAAIDVAQALGGGQAAVFMLSTPKPGDLLTLELPDWGTGLAAARLGAADVVFLAVFAAYAHRLRLRERATAASMLAALLAGAAAEVLLDARLPTIALLAAAYLVVNADRLRALFGTAREG